MTTTSILMVCLNNICRSSLSEGTLQSKLDNFFYVGSTGTTFYPWDKLNSRFNTVQ